MAAAAVAASVGALWGQVLAVSSDQVGAGIGFGLAAGGASWALVAKLLRDSKQSEAWAELVESMRLERDRALRERDGWYRAATGHLAPSDLPQPGPPPPPPSSSPPAPPVV